MCLVIDKDTKRKTAEEDITVYKVVIKTGSEDSDYLTSWQQQPVSIGDCIKSKFTMTEEFGRTIEKGLHSYKYLKDALMVAREFQETVVECIIPKKAHYYEGRWNFLQFRINSIASNKLIYKKEIKSYEG